MSCTIYYKGTLKADNGTNDAFEIIEKHTNNFHANLLWSNSSAMINFMEGQTESLVFAFRDNKIDTFWKWNGENPEEVYKVFDMFFELKAVFKSFHVNDDYGLWQEYMAKKNPCKIKLRPLSTDEKMLLERVYENEASHPSELEKYIITKSRFNPFHKGLLRVIVQDFIEIMKMDSVEDFEPQIIIDSTDALKYYGKNSCHTDNEHFDFMFSSILIEIWISYTFSYKNIGIVKDLAADVRGALTSKEAALNGLKSIFLNKHSGGSSNAKEAEMRKFAKKYYKTSAMGNVMVIDEPERELEMLFSMMDYLGFSYVSIE